MAAEVRYVLVGGAVLLHGHARTTADLNIFVYADLLDDAQQK